MKMHEDVVIRDPEELLCESAEGRYLQGRPVLCMCIRHFER